VTARWNIGGLLSALTARGRQPAVISFGEGGTATWDSATLADKVLVLARGLRDAGVSGGDRVTLWAPNSPVWIVAALAVLTAGGYGLAETASLFTGNRPGARRPGSVGRPLADGKVRISDPNEKGVGEIELHGSSITKGYLDNPEANQEAFTADGWYRTGIWALSIATASCSSQAAPRKSSCWAAARRWPPRIWSRSIAAHPKSPRSRSWKTKARDPTLLATIIRVCADRPAIAAHPTWEITAFPAAGTLCRGARRAGRGGPLMR
jgi:hypothetical protein